MARRKAEHMANPVGGDPSEAPVPSSSDADFTEAHYAEILDAALRNYRFATYDAIPWDEQFVLWRHDVDISLNRSRRLAEIEAARGVVATYFIDIHSTFYNAFEAAQSAALRAILALGHRLGVHFDANYYGVQDEADLEELVARESALLSATFGTPVDAMSFHNPSELHLTWTEDRYAGLVNCYSQRLRESTSYCSDSKGYWRFRRLFDVVDEAVDRRLQVLTHPGLWQAVPMAPRQRLSRAAYGRARAVMRDYDELTSTMGRVNLTGQPDQFAELGKHWKDEFPIWDFLWNEGQLGMLLISLLQTSRGHQSEIEPSVAEVEGVVRGPGSAVGSGIDSKELGVIERTARSFVAGEPVASDLLLSCVESLVRGMAKIGRESSERIVNGARNSE